MRATCAIFTLVFSLYAGVFYGQCGEPETDLLVENNDDLAELVGCDSILGNLIISGAMISYLDDLSDLEYIQGDLIVESCFALLHIDGLSNLEHIGGNLEFNNNFTLWNLEGLESLSFLGGNLRIFGNWTLIDLNGLENLETIPGDFVLQDNNVMETLEGIQNLTQINGDFFVDEDNIILDDLSATHALVQIGGDLELKLGQLTTINGFSNLEEISGSLILDDLEILANVDGFSSLSTVGDQVVIQNNNTLVNIDGLSDLLNVGGDVVIQNNPTLFLCCGIYPLLQNGTVGGVVNLSNNADNCSVIETILEDCVESLPNLPFEGVQITQGDGYIQLISPIAFDALRLFDQTGRLVYQLFNCQAGSTRIHHPGGIIYLSLEKDGMTDQRKLIQIN